MASDEIAIDAADMVCRSVNECVDAVERGCALLAAAHLLAMDPNIGDSGAMAKALPKVYRECLSVLLERRGLPKVRVDG